MALPTPTDLKTLDFVFLGQPFCQVPAKTAVTLAGMDYVYLGQPFVSNEGDSGPTPPVTSNIKFMSSVARANIKAINGIPITSIKFVAGVLAGELEYYEEVKAALGSAILAYYPLWETSGTTAEDVYNGVDATYVGSPTFGYSGIGDFYTCPFFGSAKYVNAISISGMNMAEGFISMWAALDDGSKYLDANTYYLANFNSDSTHGIFMRKNVAGLWSFYRRVGSTLPTSQIGTPRTTRWVHYCFCWSVAQQKVWVYTNGSRAVYVSGTLDAMTDTLTTARFSLDFSGWTGRLAHCIVGTGIPTDDQVWTLSRSTKQVVFEGDSRSLLKQWTEKTVEDAFPSGDLAFGGCGVCSQAVSGSTIANLITRGTTLDALIKPGVTNALVIWIGVNSVAVGAAQIYADMQTYIAARRAAGWNKIILCSEIDGQSSMDWHNTVWPALNALLYADHSFADGFADLGADARLQNALDTTYFNADKIHLTTAGYDVVASIVSPIITGLV
jgi:hypothetical protein